MRNDNLQKDFNNLRGDRVINHLIDEAERYIKYLEDKEDRLTKLETILNDISNSDMANKDEFLTKFEELKSA